MLIATLGEKGGTGKTTLATNLAGMRSASSEVLIIDADQQRSASLWVEERVQHADLPQPICIQKYGRGLGRTILAMESKYDDVIVDVGSGDSIELHQALRAVDVAVVPVQPSGLDLWTIGDMEAWVDDALSQNDYLRAYAIISRASPNPRSREINATRQALLRTQAIESRDCPMLTERVVYRRAVSQGKTVCEYQPRDARACEEIQDIYQRVFKQAYGQGRKENG